MEKMGHINVDNDSPSILLVLLNHLMCLKQTYIFIKLHLSNSKIQINYLYLLNTFRTRNVISFLYMYSSLNATRKFKTNIIKRNKASHSK